MAARNRLSFKIEGLVENGGHLDLVVFSEKVRALHKFIKVNMEEYSNRRGISSDQIAIRVVNLEHNSPAEVVCEAVCNSDPHTNPFEEVVNTLQSVKSGNTSNISYKALSALNTLTMDKTSGIRSAELEIKNGEEKNLYKLSLDRDFVEKVEKLINTEEIIMSTVDGRLEQINIHNGRNRFTIYQAILGYGISCKFNPSELEKAVGAIGRYVSVFGKCKYRVGSPSPHHIDVREMEILPDSSELPSLRDLRGISPNMTGDKSPEEFVREIRDGWDSDDHS